MHSFKVQLHNRAIWVSWGLNSSLIWLNFFIYWLCQVSNFAYITPYLLCMTLSWNMHWDWPNRAAPCFCYPNNIIRYLHCNQQWKKAFLEPYIDNRKQTKDLEYARDEWWPTARSWTNHLAVAACSIYCPNTKGLSPGGRTGWHRHEDDRTASSIPDLRHAAHHLASLSPPAIGPCADRSGPWTRASAGGLHVTEPHTNGSHRQGRPPLHVRHRRPATASAPRDPAPSGLAAMLLDELHPPAGRLPTLLASPLEWSATSLDRARRLPAGSTPCKATHNADSIIECKVIYYLEQCGLESK